MVIPVVKANMDTRINAVVLCNSGEYSTEQIGKMYEVDQRTIRRWKAIYDSGGFDSLAPKKTGPKKGHTIKKSLENRIVRLKTKYPAWGARRIKHQFNLPVSHRTVHRVFKKKGLLVRIKAKPQESKRFQRYHVDSMWQGDTFQFRIKDVGKVYVTGFTDDRSRFRIMSKVYLDKSAESSINALQWALRKGRIPKQIYLDNGKQFVAKVFKAEAVKYKIKLIFGKPYHPKGRGKIERYHKVLYRELIALKEFKSLSEFRRELYKFDTKYNNWRKHEILGWNTPASVYNNKRYFNKKVRYIKKRTLIMSTKWT
jgi:transposase InsO family protein